MRKKIHIILYIVLSFSLFYSIGFPFYFSPPTPLPPPPRSVEKSLPAKHYDYYVITDENGARELMRVRVNVYVGDEVLTEDNKLYEVTRIEENHAYAKYMKQVKL